MNLFADDYARRALVEAVLVGAVCGVVGVHVVLRRLAFFTMAMTHVTFPGIVLAALLGLNLYLGTGCFGALAVLAVAWLTFRQHGDGPSAGRGSADSSIAVGVVLSAGFALGVVLLSAQAGFTRDLSAFLVGSILTVQRSDLVVTAVAGLVIVTVLALLGKELVLGAFDREALVALGYRVWLLDGVVLLLVEATIVTAVPATGTILAVALVVAPAATARLWCARIGPMTVLSAVLGVVSGVVGLAVSQRVDVAAGGAIVLVACALFVASLLVAPRRPGTRPRALA